MNYKGHVIRPAPLQLADSGEWSLELYIGKDKDNEYVERKFYTSNTFRTEEEAINHCINFGKQIIDGEINNCTVADL
jgi:hypothetical protein